MFKGVVRKKSIVAIAIILVIALWAQNHVLMVSGTINRTVSYLVYPILLIQRSCVAPIKKWFEERQTAQELITLMKQLQNEKDELRSLVTQLQAVTTFSQDTAEVMQFKERYKTTHALLTQILVKHIADQAHFFIIDAGSSKGVEKDMIAVYKDMLVGKVIEVYPLYSKVLLITDRLCKVSAYCTATKAVGIHVGANNEGGGALHHVSHLDTVQVGDTILSSGDGLIFPRGFAVSRITSCVRNDICYDVTTESLLDMHKLSYCYLLKKGAELRLEADVADARHDERSLGL